ncbi:hypothetical protein EUTSA_v10009602mg [Eutrema salsugineum]|uniref:J domain-containing protein n=1 Tax=Eutrema salsugineum TaxID=72664 RepID=V4MR57_EUTSA|nr:hypothetical protein EUTSA_v10009602mg [Eutrema salsugineum]
MKGGGINSTFLSYCEILRVTVNSSAEQIRQAYHKLAMKWHPDWWTKDPLRSVKVKRSFQQIQEAYSCTALFGLCFAVMTKKEN